MGRKDINQTDMDALLARHAQEAENGEENTNDSLKTGDPFSSIEIDQAELDALLATTPQVITPPQAFARVDAGSTADGGNGDHETKEHEVFIPAESLTIPQDELDRLLGTASPELPNVLLDTHRKGMDQVSANNSASSENESLEMTQEQLDALLGGMGDDEIFDDSPHAVMEAAAARTPPAAPQSSDIDQAELDALLAAMGDDEIFADTPDQIQVAAAAKSPQGDSGASDIDQSELDALLAAMGDDEVFSDEGPVPKAPPPQTAHGAAKAEKTLSQEEIDAMLAALGGN